MAGLGWYKGGSITASEVVVKNAHLVDTSAAVAVGRSLAGGGAGWRVRHRADRTVPILAPILDNKASSRPSGATRRDELARSRRRWRSEEPTSMVRSVAPRLAAGLVAAVISI